MTDFASLGVSEPVLRAVNQLGFEEPSPIQAEAIPVLLAGRDLVAQAMTGTGKTAAFGIPLVERVDPTDEAIQAVVLAPTRELAVQVAESIYQLGRYRGVRVVPIYGGQPIDRQFRALRAGVQIVVATPGRLLDHIRRGTVQLDQVRMAVLDEADEMLNMGFLEDIELILARLPVERQTALFSATMPQPIRDLAARYLHDPVTIALSPPRGITVPTIRQRYYEVPGRFKFEALVRVVDMEQPSLAFVFCATKRGVDEVAEGLRARGYRVEAIHGDMNQAQRERALQAVRSGRAEILVATDVAARGLDVENVAFVINYDLPQDPEYYIHRIGRTGRAGREGEAITFVTPWEMREFRMIERIAGVRIPRATVPTATEVADRERELLAERVLKILEGGRWGQFRPIVEELSVDHDPIEIGAAALALAEAEKPGDGASRRAGTPAAAGLEEWLRQPRPERVERAARPRPGGYGRQGGYGRRSGPPAGPHRYKQERREGPRFRRP